ncbi:L-2-hydroxyglutarate oxidase [Kibdelosporangium banguiense]|uniref:L-2-hydroxyglutarate oxidase n=1 Tax=Kibdelosporangium banguiense TaxID=1365924 RepID=A0ABS4TZ84_9PSEU|nr:L-2-hydroxyglutarate oxidase [Kibdelosporangium banguiense]MBP2329225.1 L-2-hydroxyglutarate oxidase [Kibdelosporangium banguiense]
MSEHYDFCVIGAGIVGAATAWNLLRRNAGASVLLLEKEQQAGVHQTGHNSGVIHAGIYYEPGSLKARLCRRGAAWTKTFAAENGIPFRECGKLLVATDETELARMEQLVERATRNGLDAERLDAAALREREPLIDGAAALFIKETGIIDYGQVTEALVRQAQHMGGTVVTGARVVEIAERADAVTVSCAARTWQCRKLIACAGLQSDRVARLAGLPTDFQIVPFRGEYYRLPPAKAGLVAHLIYPVPDPDLPFLGVHLSPTIGGDLTVGPSAVLALGRERYSTFGFDARDVWEMLRFRGMRKVAKANFGTGLREMRNAAWKRGYLRACRKYCPSLELSDLESKFSGVRAQAVMNDGTFVHDFLLRTTPRMVHVVNAPSPAATSALPIGEMIAERAAA